MQHGVTSSSWLHLLHSDRGGRTPRVQQCPWRAPPLCCILSKTAVLHPATCLSLASAAQLLLCTPLCCTLLEASAVPYML